MHSIKMHLAAATWYDSLERNMVLLQADFLQGSQFKVKINTKWSWKLFEKCKSPVSPASAMTLQWRNLGVVILGFKKLFYKSKSDQKANWQLNLNRNYPEAREAKAQLIFPD